MEILLNGERRQVTDGMSVADLLTYLNVLPERVVVEVNLSVLKRAQHPTTVLRDGDQIEIVQFVGGGSDRLQTSDFRQQSVVCGLPAPAVTRGGPGWSVV